MFCSVVAISFSCSIDCAALILSLCFENDIDDETVSAFFLGSMVSGEEHTLLIPLCNGAMTLL